MSKFIPYPMFHDDMPVDISFVFEKERPAGKHGFLKVEGRDFVFEDGTKVKFWGTNFNGAACFPEHDYAKRVARRLAKTGINLVRLHQLDAEWHTPNIFAFTKGKRMTDAHLDPESMDRLDYLMKCLKDEGVYIYLDLLTYRKFRSDEGVEKAHLLYDGGKPYAIFSRSLIELQKELATELWTHENPYTGLKYCDDPSIVLSEITNENDLYKWQKFKTDYMEPYRTEFVELLNAWMQKNGIEKDLTGMNLHRTGDPDILDFKMHLQEEYYREMMEHLRSIGVKIPITGTNWVSHPKNLKSQLVTDYLDTHDYFYKFGCWGEFEKSCMNKSITQERRFYADRGCLYTNRNKPTYISEWDAPWPNAYRADAVLYTAAFGMFQGWSGHAIHTYAYSTKLERMNRLGKEISAEKIGDVPYRQGIFSTWNDPAKYGLFYHAALITRRGDVKAGEDLRAIYPDMNATDLRGTPDLPKVEAVSERHAVVVSFDEKDGLKQATFDDNGESITSDTGELYRNYKKNYGKIDTEMTKCAFGFLKKNGTVELNGLKVKSKTDFAVIAMSSLTEDSIKNSNNILLTTVGRAKNTNAKFKKEKMLEIGEAPVLIENIEAELELETVHDDLKVWAISAEGYYIGTVPTSYENGVMKIRLGEVSQSMYYLIVKS